MREAQGMKEIWKDEEIRKKKKMEYERRKGMREKEEDTQKKWNE